MNGSFKVNLLTMSSSPFNANRRSQVAMRTWNGRGGGGGQPTTEVNVAIVGALGVGKSGKMRYLNSRRPISIYYLKFKWMKLFQNGCGKALFQQNLLFFFNFYHPSCVCVSFKKKKPSLLK